MPTFNLYAVSVCASCRFGPYFVEPVIVGLHEKTGKPYVASMDLIGCPMVVDDFVVSGTCGEQMYGMCESLYRPHMVSKVSSYVRTMFYLIPYKPYILMFIRINICNCQCLGNSQGEELFCTSYDCRLNSRNYPSNALLL